MADQAQRSRSVYIGNLPWDVKEDELKKIFSQVGTIASLRMPVDAESQRSRGFAFCEFREQESVNVAIKHFNGYELNGRKIRVDSAANNADKDSKGVGPFMSEHQYGEPCDPVRAPEIIAEVIGNMSPDQVHAIISEAKRCIQGDPQEARVALVNNPQVTYALLLALTRGRYITAERGTEALVKAEQPLLPIFPDARSQPAFVPHIPPPLLVPILAATHPIRAIEGLQIGGGMVAPPGMPQMYAPPPVAPFSQSRGPPSRQYAEPAPVSRHYNNEPPSGAPSTRQSFNNDTQSSASSRRLNQPQERQVVRNANDSQVPYSRPFNESGQSRGGDLRRERQGTERPSRFETNDRSPHAVTNSPQIVTPPLASSVTASREEQEKAELIMQVLKLKEEDIAKMAPDQQRTIRTLRDQFKSINQ